MTDTALNITDLTVGYGSRRVLNGLSLSIPAHKFTALLGPNGCGKSTLVRSISGVLPRISGSIDLFGQPTSSFSSKALAQRVSTLAQSAQAPEGLSVADLVRQGRYPHRSLFGGWTTVDHKAVDDALRMTGLEHLRDHPLDQLSGGQRQRAWIAMTLAQQGEVLLLDEPTSFLDLTHQLDILSLVKDLITQRGVTVVAVLHDLNLAARYADHIVLLKDGQLQADGAPETVMTPDLIRKVFKVDVRVLADPETGKPLCTPKAVQNIEN